MLAPRRALSDETIHRDSVNAAWMLASVYIAGWLFGDCCRHYDCGLAMLYATCGAGSRREHLAVCASLAVLSGCGDFLSMLVAPSSTPALPLLLVRSAAVVIKGMSALAPSVPTAAARRRTNTVAAAVWSRLRWLLKTAST